MTDQELKKIFEAKDKKRHPSDYAPHPSPPMSAVAGDIAKINIEQRFSSFSYGYYGIQAVIG